MADDNQPQIGPQQLMQIMQQKIGNLELTVHSLLQVLENKDMIEEGEINDQAQEIVEQMKDKDIDGDVPVPGQSEDEDEEEE